MTTVSSDAVRQGDALLIAPGEVVPVDCVLVDRGAVLDESALTGESALRERSSGDEIMSGSVNAGAAITVRATAAAADSAYAAIVRLVREAETSRAPLVRLADRYALWFVPATPRFRAASGRRRRSLPLPTRSVAVGNPDGEDRVQPP